MRPKTALPDLNLKTKTNYYKLKDLVIPTKTLDDFNKEHKEEEREVIYFLLFAIVIYRKF